MSNPIPLLPCPWCGSENLFDAGNRDYEDLTLDCNYNSIRCDDCGAMGPSSHQSESQAIAAWNKGPYADRLEIHAAALKAHADKLKAKAAEHLAKADELLKKAEAASA